VGGIIFMPNTMDSNRNVNEVGLNIIFLVLIVGYNGFFMALWAYHFFTVLVRIHQGKIKSVLEFFGLKLKCLDNIDSYEQNLENYINQQE
jgi:hypothetical protein